MENNTKYIVYLTVNKVNNKIYIGIHKTDKKFDGYIGNGINIFYPSTIAHPKTHFCEAVKKYGFDKFHRYTLAVCDSEEDALIIEEILVNLNFVDRTDTYNMVIGGQEIHKSEIPIYQFNLNGNLIHKFPSILSASKAVGANTTSNLIAAYKAKKSYKNYFWAISPVIDIDEYHKVSQYKTVYCFDNNCNLVNSYSSLSEAGMAFDVDASRIKNAIGKQTTINKHYFSYNDKIYLNIDSNRIIYRYEINGNFIDYNSMRHYCNMLNLDSKKLHKAANAGLCYLGYLWNVINPIKMQDLTSHQKNSYKRKVGQYSMDGNLIKIYDTVKLCRDEFSNVRKVLKGTISSTKGFVFKYIEN